MKIFYSDHFVLPLPPDHRFPISKYYLLRKQVLESGRFPPEDLCIAEPATDEQILRAHDRDYLERLKAGTLTEKEVAGSVFPVRRRWLSARAVRWAERSPPAVRC